MELKRYFRGSMETIRGQGRSSLLGVWIAIFWGLSPEILACRFNVRDVGFVELQPQTYTFEVEIVDPRGDADEIRERLRSVARAALLDSNIRFELSTSEASDVGAGNLLAAQLVHPDGRELALPEMELGADYDQRFWRYTEALYSSPHRNRVFDGAIECYGSVLLVEGSDPVENARARAAIDAALTPVNKAVLENKLEKPIEEPPRVFVIPREDVESERVFLWSLGLSADHTEPQISFLYGRGRQIGEPLVGEEISEKSVYTIFSTIGLSCECGLDRSWMQGTAIPMRWDVDTQRYVAATLGFDPESPLIKMEMSQILSKRGPGSGLSPESVAGGFGARSPLATYQEHSVDGEDSGNANEFANLSPEELLAKLKQVTQSIDEEGQSSPPDSETPSAPSSAGAAEAPDSNVDRETATIVSIPESEPALESPRRVQRLIWTLGIPAILVLVSGVWIVIRSQSGR